MQKRHQKQQDNIQKQQQSSVDKLVFTSQKIAKKQRQNSINTNSSRHSSVSAKSSDPIVQQSSIQADQKVRPSSSSLNTLIVWFRCAHSSLTRQMNGQAY